MHHEPVLIPNMTLLIQVGIFFACYFVLDSLVYRPYLALLRARREQTIGLKAAAEKDRAEAERLKASYEAFLKSERKKIGAWADEERKKVQEEERSRIQSARDAAAKTSEAARVVLEEETQKARKSLDGTVLEFSSAIVSKMLGRSVQVSPSVSKQDKGVETAVPT